VNLNLLQKPSLAILVVVTLGVFSLPILAARHVHQPQNGVTQPPAAPPSEPQAAIDVLPGMPPVIDPANLYSEIRSGNMSPQTAGALERVYVPNRQSDDVYVIDPDTVKVLYHFKVGINPQHIVPSWDLSTLWVANNAEGRTDGSLTPIDPKTGRPGKSVPVDDPYNLYFMPDGSHAIVVAEEHKRLDFRDPKTMALEFSIEAPECGGINHADFSIDGRFAIFTCEFSGGLVKIDMVKHSVIGYLKLRKPLQVAIKGESTVGPDGQICSTRRGMPQDIRVSPDGRIFYVADMEADGVFLIDGETFQQVGFIPTGTGTHGLYPSRDGRMLYVANRGSHRIHGPPHGEGSISVIDFAQRKVVHDWHIPGGGSPDMGNVSADGHYLWLSGRFDNVVYRIDTSDGDVKSVAVGHEPHGLTVWPQPGRYSLGHTGNLR